MNWFKCDENGVTLTALSKMLSTIHDSLDCSISGLLKTGETDLVLKHKDIKEDSNVEVYTNVYGLCPRLVTATDGSVTVSFKEQTQDVKVKVIFKRDIDWTALSHVTVIDGDVQHKDLNLKSATMPIPVSTLPYEFKNGSAVVLNDEIHILGSGVSGNETKHYKYDGSTWTSVSTLPYNFYDSSAVVLNNEIHILGSGVSGNDTKHYKYNGSEWVEVSTLPYSFYYSNAVIFNDEIHILGGNGGETKHYKYNGSDWVEVSTLPCNLLNGTVVIYNNEIHILGGRYTEKHYKYNGSEWVEVSTLPYNFISGSAVVYNNEIHILGGSSTNDGKKHYLAENYTKTIYYEDNGE